MFAGNERTFYILSSFDATDEPRFLLPANKSMLSWETVSRLLHGGALLFINLPRPGSKQALIKYSLKPGKISFRHIGKENRTRVSL